LAEIRNRNLKNEIKKRMCHLFAHLRKVCKTNKNASTANRALSKETSIISFWWIGNSKKRN